MAASATVPHVRARRVLRLVAAAACSRARLRSGSPDRAVLRARRGLALVLRRRVVRVTLMNAVDVAQWPTRETPDVDGAYPRLRVLQVDELDRYGERRVTHAAEVLCQAGEVDSGIIVILSGLVAVIDPNQPDEPIGLHGPRRFVGELGLLTGQAALLTGVVREPGEVLTLSLDGLKEVALKDAVLADLILRALLIRRSVHIGLGAGLRILGSRFSPDSRRLRDFLA